MNCNPLRYGWPFRPCYRCLTLLLALITQTLSAFQPQQPVQPPVALTHVTVIDVSRGTLQDDMTVIIARNRIAGIGKSGSLVAPPSAQVMDARGKFLIPGLWDMHVHWHNKEYLSLFIANGVTGIRMMWGFPMHRQWREEIGKGALLGPRMVIAGPLLDGPNSIWPGSMVVSNAEQARDSVRKLKQEGIDFIKVYGLLSREAFFAIVDESRKLGLTVVGHVPQSVTALEASDAGQKSIEHLTGILDACSTREEELRAVRQEAWRNRPSGQRLPAFGVTRPLTRTLLESYSPEKAAALFERLKKNMTWQCPTLTVLRSNAFIDDPRFRNDPRLKYLPSGFKTRWDPTSNFRFKEQTAEDFEMARSVFRRQVELVGMMRRSGVEFLAGTDVLNPYCFPGFSLHDELELLVNAGLTPPEALRAATLNAARFLGREHELGTIETGKLADLVLLDANPLADIRNTRKINAVLVSGKVLDREALDRLLEEAEGMAKSN